jgi:uncharacterized membrane protein YfcA
MPEIGSQSQSLFAARIAGLWVCPKVGQIEVSQNPVLRARGVTIIASVLQTTRQIPRKNPTSVRELPAMPFFFIAPLWLLSVALGIVLLFFRATRRVAYFVIAIPTGATLVSFVLSTAVFFLFPHISAPSHPYVLGSAVLVTYLVALLVGGVLGAFAASWLTHKLIVRTTRLKS